MNRIIVFDQQNSSAWTGDSLHDLTFVWLMEDYLCTLWRSKGYLFMNEIYEALGVAWDPHDDNDCMLYNRNAICPFEFEVFTKVDGNNDKWLINILYNKEES